MKKYPKIGIRPTYRRSPVWCPRKPEEKTMNLAKAAELISSNLKTVTEVL